MELRELQAFGAELDKIAGVGGTISRGAELLSGSGAKRMANSVKLHGEAAKSLAAKGSTVANLHREAGAIAGKRLATESAKVTGARAAAGGVAALGAGGLAAHKEQPKTAGATDKAKGLGRVGQLLSGSRTRALKDHAKDLHFAADQIHPSGLMHKTEERVRGRLRGAAHTAAEDAAKEHGSVTKTRLGAGAAGAAVGGAAIAAHKSKEEKTAADLTPEARSELPKKDFAVSAKKSNTGEKAYPIPDRRHAASALGFAKMHGDSTDLAAVRAKIQAKYPDMLQGKTAMRADVMTAFAKESGALMSSLANGPLSHKMEIGGLGILAAPVAHDLYKSVKAKDKGGIASSGAELGGLGVLAAPAIAALRHH